METKTISIFQVITFENQMCLKPFLNEKESIVYIISKEVLTNECGSISKRIEALKESNQIADMQTENREGLKQLVNETEAKCRIILRQFPSKKSKKINLIRVAEVVAQLKPSTDHQNSPVDSAYVFFSSKAHQSGEESQHAGINARKIVKEILILPNVSSKIKLMNGKEKEAFLDFTKFVGSARCESTTTESTRSYEGEFIAGIPQGYGETHSTQKLETQLRIEKFMGLFKNEKLHGYGKSIIKEIDVSSNETTTQIYQGQWKDGHRHGIGELTLANGNIYKGQIANNQFHGFGIMTYTDIDGSIYIGQWFNGQKQGHGELRKADGSALIGNWFNDYIIDLNEPVTQKFANGDVYTGTMCIGRRGLKGQRHGQGVMTYAPDSYCSYAKYEGTWKYGLPNGQGTLTFSNNNVYVGTFVNGRRSGQGVMTYAPDSHRLYAKYEGTWKSNATLSQQNLDTEKDAYIKFPGNFEWETSLDWRNSRLREYFNDHNEGVSWTGQGTLTYRNGDIYEGQFDCNRLHGSGVLKNNTGTILQQGIWEKGSFLSEKNESILMSR